MTHKDSIYIEEIDFNNLENYTRAYVLGKLRFRNNTKISHNFNQDRKNFSELGLLART